MPEPFHRPGGEPYDRIAVTGIRAHGHHGVFAEEKRDGHEFVIDVVLHLDVRGAATGDDLTATAHYGLVAETVAAVVAEGSLDLIETLATRIADTLLDQNAAASAVDVVLHKPTAPLTVPFDDVTVSIRRTRPATAVLALGSNLGDRQAALRDGLAALSSHPRLRFDAVSPVVETDPVGGPAGQDPFLNAIVTVTTDLSPFPLLAVCQRIERRAGRVRRERWGPRVLDIDIVTMDAPDGTPLVADLPGLSLPHPRTRERAFVLAPWHLLDPEAVLPGPLGGDVAALLERAADRAGVRVRSDLDLRPAAGGSP